MSRTMLGKFLDSMDDDKAYNFIANNYWQMSKADLKTVLLEYIYAVHNSPKETQDEINERIRDNIEEREIVFE